MCMNTRAEYTCDFGNCSTTEVGKEIVDLNAFKLPLTKWDRYFLDIAKTVSTRSTCSRRQVGAVIVRDHYILSTGYNGTPKGLRNCNEGGCPRCAGTAPSGTALLECLCSHAEENAIVQAAYHGTSIKDGTLYCTISPCLHCAKMIINAGIRHVCFSGWYQKPESFDNDPVIKLFKEAQIQITPPEEK